MDIQLRFTDKADHPPNHRRPYSPHIPTPKSDANTPR
jgi:hypothetical protein